jgi:hypothetical protein
MAFVWEWTTFSVKQQWKATLTLDFQSGYLPCVRTTLVIFSKFFRSSAGSHFQRTCGAKLKLLHFSKNWPLSVRCPLTIGARTSGRIFLNLTNVYVFWQYKLLKRKRFGDFTKTEHIFAQDVFSKMKYGPLHKETLIYNCQTAIHLGL